MSKKKPTKKDMEIVMSNVINHLQVLTEKIAALDNVFGAYIKFKKDDKKFQGYIKKQLKQKKDEQQGN